MSKIQTLREYYDKAQLDLRLTQAILSNIEGLVKGAILDPSEEIRNGLIDTLGKVFSGTLKSGFEADGQLYLALGYEGNRGVFLICDMPKEYAGGKSRARRFDI